MEKRYLSLSVHQLVDALLRVGDIDDRVYNQETMRQGSRLHSLYQSEQDSNYVSEMFLSHRIEVEGGVITLSGRADGVILGKEYPIIDEIKTSIVPVEVFAADQEAWHLGQAQCYAYMYLCMQGGEKAGIRLTYIHQIHIEDKLIKDYEFSFDELEKAVKGYCRDYLEFLAKTFAHEERRDQSVLTAPFPYGSFRKGQRELAKYVYGIAHNGGTLFAEAPTGIGKTMSTLYPASKKFHRGRVDKIFYLTAKTTGALSCASACEDMRKSGTDIWYIPLRSKEKICFCPGASCNPEDCPFARGYYEKLRGAITDALDQDRGFDADFLTDLALKHDLCPFEFQLDLSNHCDVIIGDYNYFFDPIVHLERYFDETVDSSTYLVLADEAHNLIDRGREMYSASLSRDLVKNARQALKGDGYRSIRKALIKVESYFDALSIQNDEYAFDLPEPPEELGKALTNLKAVIQRASKKRDLRLPSEYREFSREANRYMRMVDEFYGPEYAVYVRKERKDVILRLLCVDPSKHLNQSNQKVRGSVYFSATLSPIRYYMDSLLGGVDHPYLLLSSPFPKENMKLMIAPKISVRYKDRAKSYGEVARYLEAFVSHKVGNYFLYFPSYEYLEAIQGELNFADAEVLTQARSMTPGERNEFLEYFSPNPDHTKIGLLILGGVFSEGVDLVDDRLIGVAVVGIGIPQIGKENDLIRNYHDKKGDDGFAYAYLDPGMNKVLQAVGRLIRSESDRGAALLIDDRYLRDEYRALFQRIYQDYDVVLSPQEVNESLDEWEKNFKKESL